MFDRYVVVFSIKLQHLLNNDSFVIFGHGKQTPHAKLGEFIETLWCDRAGLPKCIELNVIYVENGGSEQNRDASQLRKTNLHLVVRFGLG